jgi:hypothetical protein
MFVVSVFVGFMIALWAGCCIVDRVVDAWRHIG